MRRHQGAKIEHYDVSNVIYHKFSHGAVSYSLNGENVNVVLELHFQGIYGDRKWLNVFHCAHCSVRLLSLDAQREIKIIWYD